MSLSAAPTVSLLNPRMGAGINFTFFEQYGDFRELFLIPNSFFLSADLVGISNEMHKEKDNWKWDGRYAFSGGIFNLGTNYKIRLDQNQRFITNFGIFFSLFTLKADHDIDYTTSNGENLNYKDDRTYVRAGAGANAGLCFRFTPFISLDLGLSWKTVFDDKGLKRVETLSIAGGGTRDIEGTSNNKEAPFGFLLASLGITVWFPR
jgi:hypothetical protein